MDKEEKFRLLCELRYWISKGYTNPEKYRELEKSIAKHRGMDSAKQLTRRIEWYRLKCKTS